MQTFEVGTEHKDVLAARNEVFARQMRRCLRTCHAAIAGADAESDESTLTFGV